jgi:hypothetical protein
MGFFLSFYLPFLFLRRLKHKLNESSEFSVVTMAAPKNRILAVFLVT